MFAAIHQFLHDFRPLVLLVTIPVTLFYGWRIWVLLQAPAQPKTAQVRRPGARPVPPKPAGSTTGVQQNLLERSATASNASQIGEESRRAKAQEPTIRIGSADQRPDSAPKHTTADLLGKSQRNADPDDEVGALFAGLDDQLTPKPPKDVHARATRLEELGFHHSIPSDAPKGPETPSTTVAKANSDTDSDHKATVSDLATNKPGTEDVPPAPQLDDILARLDRVLADEPSAPEKPADDTASAATPAPDAPPAPPKMPPPPKAPSWARADVTDEDLDEPVKGDDEGRQLGLFDREKTNPDAKSTDS